MERERIYKRWLGIRIDEDLLKRLNDVVKASGRKKSELVREGILKIVRVYGRKRKKYG